VATRFQITLEVSDEAGVLASIASVFALNGVSVETVQQSPSDAAAAAALTVMTHVALESDLEKVVTALSNNEAVVSVNSVIRVEGL
jgi:homoserine dehydrogenase